MHPACPKKSLRSNAVFPVCSLTSVLKSVKVPKLLFTTHWPSNVPPPSGQDGEAAAVLPPRSPLFQGFCSISGSPEP